VRVGGWNAQGLDNGFAESAQRIRLNEIWHEISRSNRYLI
jgi:hypothetical protein